MDKSQYAVVRVDLSRGVFSFSVFHNTFEEAQVEALRLAEKEGHKFVVLKVVGYADKKPLPVEWVDV